MLTVRDAVPETHHLARAEFATLRLQLLKLGARAIETVSRIRLAFASACPKPNCSAGSPSPCSPPDHDHGPRRPDEPHPSNPQHIPQVQLQQR
jgi:hypothetical protein